MIDYYKILNVDYGATEAVIKKKFRELANKYHPDKNGGSKYAEEQFKIILTAYETLNNNISRAAYDVKYKEYLQQQRLNTFYQKPKNEKSSPKVNYRFWFFLILLIIFLYNIYKTTIANSDDRPEIDNRPKSGELNFSK